MKGLIKKILFSFYVFFILLSVTKAETFYEGKYINDEYINKVIDGKTYYMTMQYIKDSKGNIVYCLEPFTKFVDGKVYTEYSDGLVGYDKLSDEQKRKISLIIYYGYGYGNRTDSKWYVVTQYLVWKEVGGNANIYFTDTLNGKKITKYVLEQDLILNDVKLHDVLPKFVKDYNLNYMDDLLIEGLNKNYKIENIDYAYGYNNDGNIVIPDIKDNTIIKFRKISNYYNNKVTIYDSSNSQDVIRPGNVLNYVHSVNINVTKGDITLDIKKDDSVYTVESDFSNTCYEISDKDKVIDTVCTGDDSLIYKTDTLGYGKYFVKQISVGTGYVFDNYSYEVVIDDNNPNPVLILYNKLLKNDIELVKYACKNDECVFEKDAMFEIVDKNKNIVSVLFTNEEGYSNITLGYGKYTINQIKGKAGYTISDSFDIGIVDESTKNLKKLYNYYIEKKDEEVKGEVVIIEDIPDTKVDSKMNILMKFIYAVLEGIFAFLE